MFEGLLAPWHLLILAAVVLLVLGPHRLADRWHGIVKGVQHLGEGTTNQASDGPEHRPEDEPPERKRPPLAYRLGRRLRRRRL